MAHPNSLKATEMAHNGALIMSTPLSKALCTASDVLTVSFAVSASFGRAVDPNSHTSLAHRPTASLMYTNLADLPGLPTACTRLKCPKVS